MKKWAALLLAGALLAGCAAAKPAAKTKVDQPKVEPTPQPQAQQKKKLMKGEDPGTTVQVSYDPAKLPRVAPTFTDVKTGPLLFSDAPEYVDGTGVILYSDLQPGDFRFYLYHVNSNTTDAYFCVVLTNKGDKEATVKVGNNSMPAPGKPYGPVGFALQTGFYSGEAKGWELKIKPGERACLDPRLLKTPVKYNDLLAGIWDVVTDQPLDVHEIVTLSSDLPDPSKQPKLPRVNNGGAGVGTFSNYRRKVRVVLDGSKQVYYIASGENGDTWLKGPDKGLNAMGELVGNYGMDYEVTMEFNSPVDRTVKVWMSTVVKLGGAIRVDGNMIRIPEDNFGNIDAPFDSVLITKLALKAGKPTTFTYEFMPPGAFYLPAFVHVEPVGN